MVSVADHYRYQEIACTTSSLDSCSAEADWAARVKGIGRGTGRGLAGIDRIAIQAEEKVMAVARMELARVVDGGMGKESRRSGVGHS